MQQKPSLLPKPQNQHTSTAVSATNVVLRRRQSPSPPQKPQHQQQTTTAVSTTNAVRCRRQPPFPPPQLPHQQQTTTEVSTTNVVRRRRQPPVPPPKPQHQQQTNTSVGTSNVVLRRRPPPKDSPRFRHTISTTGIGIDSIDTARQMKKEERKSVMELRDLIDRKQKETNERKEKVIYTCETFKLKILFKPK